MSEPILVMERLSKLANDLDNYSRALGQVEAQLEPLEIAYEEHMADHELALWEAHNERGEKLPPQGLRDRMAYKALPYEMRQNRAVLLSKRKRMEKRLAAIKTEIDAQRSLLSALKAAA